MIIINIEDVPNWFSSLESEDAEFVKNFILKSGNIKEVAKFYDVSYPTVRLRLDRLIQKIQINDKRDEQPFRSFIKELAVDEKIDLNIAKIIIEKYEKQSKEENV
ncbi:DUF2089 family protein [Enterococcus sp. LJL51]|uniref:DUF2089 family protein n=1 Tax=Enterococcus sp. LJL51 TaxID=3416656 RepID=UPI003CF1440D